MTWAPWPRSPWSARLCFSSGNWRMRWWRSPDRSRPPLSPVGPLCYARANFGSGGTIMSATFKTLDELDLNNKRVLLRADLNVPVADGKVTDATRIERLVPTIREIVKHDGKAILLSHFGRPKGKVDPEFSLEQVCEAVANATGHPVGFIATDWIDMSAAQAAIDSAPPGSVLIMENTRFHPGEEANDLDLAKRMASLGDVYVND